MVDHQSIDLIRSALLFHLLCVVFPELEWKLVYVGSAEDDQYDQELDSVLVGPIIVGKNKFVFEAAAPDPTLIPSKDIMEVTVLLLTCAYKEKEFIRIGYYVMNDYDPSEVALVQARDAWLTHSAQLQHDYATQVNAIKAEEERLRAAGQFIEALPLPPQPVIPPAPAVDISKLTRNILADKPRVTRFQIPWDEADPTQEVRIQSQMQQAKAIVSNNDSMRSTFKCWVLRWPFERMEGLQNFIFSLFYFSSPLFFN